MSDVFHLILLASQSRLCCIMMYSIFNKEKIVMSKKLFAICLSMGMLTSGLAYANEQEVSTEAVGEQSTISTRMAMHPDRAGGVYGVYRGGRFGGFRGGSSNTNATRFKEVSSAKAGGSETIKNGIKFKEQADKAEKQQKEKDVGTECKRRCNP